MSLLLLFKNHPYGVGSTGFVYTQTSAPLGKKSRKKKKRDKFLWELIGESFDELAKAADAPEPEPQKPVEVVFAPAEVKTLAKIVAVKEPQVNNFEERARELLAQLETARQAAKLRQMLQEADEEELLAVILV